jgi:DNA ligase (NAD+)
MTQASTPAADRRLYLEGCIRRSRHAYYNPDARDVKPEDIVPDDVYEAWYAELDEMDSKSRALLDIGAAPAVNSPWQSVRHDIPMGSLDKVQSLEEMTNWIFKRSLKDADGRAQLGMELFLTEKLDGISIHVKYKRGKFVQAITRGDGVTGEDITRNVAKMQGVPPTFGGDKFTGALRGEIILYRADMAKYFPDKVSPRNAAAGIAKRLDGEGCEHLYVYFYQVAEGKDFETEYDQFQWLQSLGLFVPNWYVTAMIPGVKTPHDLWVEYQQTKRTQLEYDIDGLVIRVNKLAHQLSLGEENGNPLGAVAFKFTAIARETLATGCLEQTGSMGTITPVAVFDPVNLVGAQVTNASLYNWRYIREIGFDVGARILVARANDVIPRVVRVTHGTGKTYPPPTVCTSCGASVVQDGDFYLCPNTAECPAQAVGRVKRYVKSHNMLGWGEGLIERLVDTGLVKTVADLYRLTEEQLANIERMGLKSAKSVRATLWEKNPITIEDLLGSLSIPICGKDTIQLLTDAGLNTIAKMRAATTTDLIAIRGLGPVKAAELYGWFQKDSGIVDELDTLGVHIAERIVGGLTGKTFCFTGSSRIPRDKLTEIAEAAGAIVKNSVTKKLTYLVMANPTSNTTKAQAARKNGTQCIDEETFLKLAGYDASKETPAAPAVIGIDSPDGDVSLVDEV